MSCRRTLLLAGLLCILSNGACQRGARQPVERLGIAPFEDLSEDAEAAWAGWAIAEAAAAGISGSLRIHPVRLADGRNSAAAGVTAELAGYLTVAGGRLRLRVTRLDLSSRRVTGSLEVDEAFPDGVLRTGDALARWIDPNARPFDTRSVAALQAFAQGREAAGTEEALKAYERSVTADPDFGAPYVAWTQALVLGADRAGAEQVLERARARGDRIAQSRRVELDLLAAALSGDQAGRRKALIALTKATPADAAVFRQLAAEEAAARRYQDAAALYRKVVELDPLNGPSWNQLGYAEASRRNLEGARSALTEYARLEPGNANPSDSLGDVHYHLGAFEEAEKHYLRAFEIDPSFLGGADLYKAARARLMTGDASGAEALFRRYVESTAAAGDGLADFREAQWLYLTGRREEAVARAKRFALSARAPQWRSAADSQLSVWGAMAGVAEDRARCEKIAGERGRAVVLLLSGRFADAADVLEGLVAKGNSLRSDRADVLLAWALVETGRVEKAVPLLEVFGVPSPGLEDVFAALSFPRVFQLRAAAFDKAGRSREAAEARDVLRRLSGK
ncbi:MAG TPA: tetratricopeptide repeat protein [Bryobacteraceae bacterium]|nr:tetratricopeptide repeat protein [Bryobacteraceae bacterium]